MTDADGNDVSSNPNHIGNINPIRYRSYYFDTETGYYYLNSRYYSPEMCRFINADGIINANQDILGNNLFAYCSNNPVNNCDTNGCGKISNWVRTAVQNFKNWWNATPPASSFTVPSSSQIPGTVADVVLGQTEKYLGGKTIPSPWGPSSRGTVRGTPWATQPKYAKEIRTASKGAAVISVATLSLDLANTWTSNNGNTNGDRVLKSVVQITSTAAGVLVGVAAAAAFTAVSAVASPIGGAIALAAITYGGSVLIDYVSQYYYDTVGIE